MLGLEKQCIHLTICHTENPDANLSNTYKHTKQAYRRCIGVLFKDILNSFKKHNYVFCILQTEIKNGFAHDVLKLHFILHEQINDRKL